MSNAAPEILSVVDTREYEEVSEGKYVAIAGSGDCRECDRCGRTHEVHATVRYPDGAIKVVGTGCMELGSAVARKMASKASTLARLRAELAGARARLKVAGEQETAVAAMTAPAVVASRHPKFEFDVLQCGDGAAIWCQFVKTPADLAERHATAVRSWRDARLCEMGHRRSTYSLQADVSDLEIRLARAGG
jgi:hypothetical protein